MIHASVFVSFIRSIGSSPMKERYTRRISTEYSDTSTFLGERKSNNTYVPFLSKLRVSNADEELGPGTPWGSNSIVAVIGGFCCLKGAKIPTMSFDGSWSSFSASLMALATSPNSRSNHSKPSLKIRLAIYECDALTVLLRIIQPILNSFFRGISIVLTWVADVRSGRLSVLKFHQGRYRKPKTQKLVPLSWRIFRDWNAEIKRRRSHGHIHVLGHTHGFQVISNIAHGPGNWVPSHLTISTTF